jgi:tetratricopeptide (TPR) repeat protein
LRGQGKLAEAITAYREAIRLKPDYAVAHSNLGTALRGQGKLAEAIAVYREAIRLKPDFAAAHFSLGVALRDQGKLTEAIAAFREAIRLEPDNAWAHYNLALALAEQGKQVEAIAAYREAIRLAPDYAEAHCNLGLKLREQGRYSEALAELRRGHELGSKRPHWHHPSAQWVRDCKRMVAIEVKLPAFLKGEAQPADAASQLALAQMCYDRKLYATAARFWGEAFQADAKLADDIQALNRYNAACSAALAGCGQSKDDPPPSEEAKARLRRRALDWLKADLAYWTKQLETGPPQARALVSQSLRHWKVDSDLAGIRDATALKALPVDEQRACRALWAEVDELLAKARAGTAP